MRLRFVLLPLMIASPAIGQTPDVGEWRTLRIAKWSAAGASAGAALYGFYHNQQADQAYERLERSCQDNHLLCLSRQSDGAYDDPAMEAEYQIVKHHDRRARAGLVAGQIGIATSVVLFILDLRNDRPPPNIPFDPRGLEVRQAPDGGVSFGYRLRTR